VNNGAYDLEVVMGADEGNIRMNCPKDTEREWSFDTGKVEMKAY